MMIASCVLLERRIRVQEGLPGFVSVSHVGGVLAPRKELLEGEKRVNTVDKGNVRRSQCNMDKANKFIRGLGMRSGVDDRAINRGRVECRKNECRGRM